MLSTIDYDIPEVALSDSEALLEFVRLLKKPGNTVTYTAGVGGNMVLRVVSPDADDIKVNAQSVPNE